MWKQYHQKNNTSKVLGIGILGLAAGAALGMLFSPRSGKENRKRLGNWMNDMRSEINDRYREMADKSREKYDELVDTVSDKYRKMQDIKENEVSDLAQDLKMHWSNIKDKWNE